MENYENFKILKCSQSDKILNNLTKKKIDKKIEPYWLETKWWEKEKILHKWKSDAFILIVYCQHLLMLVCEQ